MRQLVDKVAVITGAGGGLGRALCEQLARRGCDLALVDIDADALAATAAVVEGLGRCASSHLADVADRAAMLQLPDAVLRAHGRVDVLVNNAGVTLGGGFVEQSLEDFDWIVGVNLWGALHACRVFLPHLLRAPEAHIVNLSSMLGLVGFPHQALYATTKAAIRGLSESLAMELYGTRVRVTVVCPGAIRTGIVRAARFVDAAEQQLVDTQMQRWALRPERAARAIVRAVRHNRRQLVIGPEAHLIAWLNRWLPRLLHHVVGWGYARARRRRPLLATAPSRNVEPS